MEPYYKDEKTTLYNSDCLSALGTIGQETVDVTITSPPYNLNKKYKSYKDKLPLQEYVEWIANVSKEINRVLKKDGSYFLNIGYQNTNPTIPFLICNELTKIFELQNTIIWAKSITVNNESFGHFTPNNSNKYLNNFFEYMFHFTKTGEKTLDKLSIGVPYKDKRNMERFQNNKDKGDVRCRGNIWFIPYRTTRSKDDKFNHPTAYPEELVEKCIKLNGYNQSTTVLDPFCGSGTTLKVSSYLDINSIGIEIDKDYCEVTKNRIKQTKE
jgi:site-specific DNA-methyltransferase (adenine-specific)